MKIGSVWVSKYHLRNNEIKYIKILNYRDCRWNGGERVEYDKEVVLNNFIPLPEELWNESEETIRLYLAL